MTFLLTMTVDSAELRLALEPVAGGGQGGTWTKQYVSGLDVEPVSGDWAHQDGYAQIWVMNGGLAYATVDIATDWPEALNDGRSVLGQGLVTRASDNRQVNVTYRLEQG